MIAPFIFSGWLLVMFFFPEFNYYSYTDTPKEIDLLIIEHRNWSLGETHHLYNFYQETFIPGLTKKVNHETMHIMTRNSNADDLEVLGINNAEWVGVKKVIFNSPFAETCIELK